MSDETITAQGQEAAGSPIGATLDDLCERIHGAWMLSNEYPTRKLLVGPSDVMFKQLVDFALDMAFTGKDYDFAHRANAANAYMEKVPATIAARSQGKEAKANYDLCNDAANIISTIMIIMERFGITREELAAAIDEHVAAEGLPSGDLLAPGQVIPK